MLEILKVLHSDFEFDNHTVTYARGDIRDPHLVVNAKKEYEEMNKFLTSLSHKK